MISTVCPPPPSHMQSCSMITACMHCVCSLCVGLPEETLEGHRDRFNRQYSALRKYFNETRKMKYFDGLVEIPQLREVRSLHAHLADWFSQCQALHPGLITSSLPCEENSRDALLRLVARMSCVAYVLSNTHVSCLPSPLTPPSLLSLPMQNPPNFLLPPDQRQLQQQASQPAEPKVPSCLACCSVPLCC